MLLDVAGTLIAFISVILLLSILVTATVQLIQSVLRLRGRNLLKGLAQLIMTARGDERPSGFGWLRGKAAKAKSDAAKVLNESNVALINKVSNPENWLHYWILGPKVSWVEPDDIVKPVKEITGIDEEKAKQIGVDLDRAGVMLKDRFQLIIRAITFGVGLLIVFGFQVSTPQLFSDLSEQTATQQKIAGDANELLKRIGEQLESGGTPGEAAPVKSPEELQTEVQGILNELSQYKLEFWADDNFYFEPANATDTDKSGVIDRLKFEALLGVFLTAILLSLGASFWYEQLRNVIRFRDLLSGAAGMGDDGTLSDEQATGKGKPKKGAGKKGSKKKKKSKKKQGANNE